MAVGRNTLFGIVTLIVGPGLIVIDRCLALGEWVKRTGPREGMWRVVGLRLCLCLGMGVVYRDWLDYSRGWGVGTTLRHPFGDSGDYQDRFTLETALKFRRRLR